jgi:hypothetical protein
MDERWLPVVGYEGFYEVSDTGRVRALERSGVHRGRWGDMVMRFPAREMRICTTTAGYHYVALKLPSQKSIKYLLHRLVMFAFVGVPPQSRPQVNHKDGNKANNRLDNLEYVSSAENLKHCIQVLGKKRGESAGNARLTDAQVLAIRKDRRLLREVAADHGVSLQTISKVRNGHAWAHVRELMKERQEA